MKCSAIVMASGLSRRMGKNKLLLPYRGKPIAAYTLDLVKGLDLKERILVTAYDEVAALGKERGFQVVINDENEEGKAASIRKGLDAAEDADGYLFFVADQPLLKKETVEKMLRLFEKENRIIAPVYRGRKGNPVLFPAGFKEELSGLTGDEGGSKIVKRESYLPLEIDNPRELEDIDTVESYERLKRNER